MAQQGRQYECVLLGATGYTGKYAAEHITTHLPTDFKWAVAGRSQAKLNDLVADLKALSSDRTHPGIESVQLEENALVDLARKTKVLITTIGPYHRYGTAVVKACAESGTHYLDVTGEIPWVYDMVHNYDKTAKRTGAIMIPQNGFESAPPDLMCWMLVSNIREALGVGTAEIIHTVHDINGSVSGGTLATLLGIFDHYTTSQFARSQQRWSLCPIAPPNPKQSGGTPLLETITGVRTDKDLGTLTDSIQRAADTPIVHRTWGLYDEGKFYGPKFRFNTYTKTRNALTAFVLHVTIVIAFTALFLSPVRWLLKSVVYQPGEGPTREQDKSHYVEWRAIANADTTDPNDPKRAYATMKWKGSMYHLTGVLSAEAAFVLAREKTFASGLGGGMLTPATLGVPYLERLQKAGLQTEVRMLP